MNSGYSQEKKKELKSNKNKAESEATQIYMPGPEKSELSP